MAKILNTEIPNDPMHKLVGRHRHTIEFECTRCKKTSSCIVWGTLKFVETWQGLCDKCEEKE